MVDSPLAQPAQEAKSPRLGGFRPAVRLEQRNRRAAPQRTTLQRHLNPRIRILRLSVAPPQPLHPAPQLRKSLSHGASSRAVYTPVDLKWLVVLAVSADRQVFKPRALRQVRQVHRSRRTVALLRDNDLRLVRRIRIGLPVLIAVVIALAMNERHHVRILLDRARFTQIR